MYYDLARWYDPVTGRFIQRDPAGFGAGDSNLKRYVGNNPTNGIDPTGLMCVPFPIDPDALEAHLPEEQRINWRPTFESNPRGWYQYGYALGQQLAWERKTGKERLKRKPRLSFATTEDRNAYAQGYCHGLGSVEYRGNKWKGQTAPMVLTLEGAQSWMNNRRWQPPPPDPNLPIGGIVPIFPFGPIGRIPALPAPPQRPLALPAPPQRPLALPAPTIRTRLREFYNRLGGQQRSTNAEEALGRIRRTMDEVEDAMSGIPKKEPPPPPKLPDGRMYPPRDDFVTRNPDGSISARTAGHNIEIGKDGSIKIISRKTKGIEFEQPGADQ
jgi:hypothetical protein